MDRQKEELLQLLRDKAAELVHVLVAREMAESFRMMRRLLCSLFDCYPKLVYTHEDATSTKCDKYNCYNVLISVD